MRKLVVGLLVALIVSAGGYMGVVAWAERTAAREVDAMLDRWRSGGGTATRGRVAFELWTRTVRVADVALESPSSPDEKVTIEQAVASGIDPSGRARRLDILGLEVSQALPGTAGARMRQQAPRVTFTDFSERPMAPRTKAASPVDAMRLWLEQFSAIAASSIEVPSLTVAMTPVGGTDRPDLPGAAEYTYSNLVLREVANGRVAEATVENVALRGSAGPMRQGFTGEMGGVSVRDIDMAPVLAWLDPSRPREEGYQRVYGQLAAGPYTVRFGDGGSMGVDRIVAEEIGLRPAKLSLEDLGFLLEVTRPGITPPTPGQLSMLVDKMGGLYEGIHLDKLQMQGLRVVTPREGVKIASVALNGLDNGRLADLSIEGLDSQTPTREPVSVGRMTLKGFHVANLFRTLSTQLGSLAERPGRPSPLLAMLGLIEGVELRDFAAPDPKTGRVVHLEAIDASWGQLVGGIPSEARLSAKVSAPITPVDPEAFIRALAVRGIASMAVSLDLGMRWREAEQSVVMAPATMEIRDVLALSVKAAANKVPREMLSTDIIKVMGAAPLVEAGPTEVTIRDLGVVDLAAAEIGQAKGGDAQEGRAVLVESLAQKAAAATQTSPELQPFFDALTRFVQGKGQTLTITLTPKGGVGLLQLIEAARRDAVGAFLANFTVEARTGG